MVRESIRRHRLVAALGLALYALTLAVTPLAHHDVACHLKTPSHCDACTSTTLAPRAEAVCALSAPRLIDAGRVEGAEASAPAVRILLQNAGRAPPA
jgi:hypothetical protein